MHDATTNSQAVKLHYNKLHTAPQKLGLACWQHNSDI